MRFVFALRVFLGVGVGLALNVCAQDVRTYVPPKAQTYLPTVSTEVATQWPQAPSRAYFGALIEHESCISLTHSRCWSPTSRLKTKREEGAGLGQLTRAYTASGSLRFDALADMRAAHPALSELTWSNVYSRPDLQIRAVVLKIKSNYQALAPNAAPMQRLAFADAAYNGGLGGVAKERRACGLSEGCDPNQWFGHVERHCLKSKRALYVGRSACDINRHHVVDVLKIRLKKYESLLET